MKSAPVRKLAAAAVIAVLCVACGGEETPEPTPRPTVARTGLPSREAVAAAVLEVRDLPRGWGREELEVSDLTNECAGALDDVVLGDVDARSAFTRGEPQDHITSEVGGFEDQNSATQAMAEAREALQCPPWTEQIDGNEAQFQLGALEAPDLGDETVAYRSAFNQRVSENSTISVVANVVAVRRRNVISRVSHFSVSTSGPRQLDPALVRQLAETADEKLVGIGL